MKDWSVEQDIAARVEAAVQGKQEARILCTAGKVNTSRVVFLI